MTPYADPADFKAWDAARRQTPERKRYYREWRAKNRERANAYNRRWMAAKRASLAHTP